MSEELLLELRKRIKKKKPNFIRQDAHKKKRLGKKWRKPKGIQSKMRLRLSGYRKSVSKGYKSPREVRGLDKSGLRPVLVSSIGALRKIEKETQGIIISKVGLKKRIEIIKEAEKAGIKILNIKNPKEFLSYIEELLKKRKEGKKKEKGKEKKVEVKKEEKKEEKTEKEKSEEERREKDKILTKKQ